MIFIGLLRIGLNPLNSSEQSNRLITIKNLIINIITYKNDGL